MVKDKTFSNVSFAFDAAQKDQRLNETPIFM